MNITQHERDRAFDLLTDRLGPWAARLRINPRTFETENAEMAPAGGKIRIRYLLDTFQWHIFN
jgi:head-tail adaptor